MKNIIDGPDSLGKIDRNILRILQKDGRISYTELARQVGLSVTPCIDRVKRMERNGYILGYSAQVCSQKLDAALVVFVQIRLNHTSQKNFEEFRRSVIDLENIQSCFLVSGNYDYLLKARVADMAAYRELLGHRILKLPAVQESTSYVVMEELKETMEVPINYKSRSLI
ncbi:MAG: Lrp/AsnC family leucine-responsive transcriptional regulator [Porticoccaceae bacterium]|jgi:Lrp/AsnC family leucine-responsive transcriptional regulator|tara:strand:+ start:1113 stop:1619 length:507 start_codon:yes stop_codon:yes gene_type:complete